MTRVSVRGFVMVSIISFLLASCASEPKITETVDKALTPPETGTSMEVIKSEYKPGEIKTKCQNGISLTESVLNEIVKLPVNGRNIESTVLRFENVTADLTDTAGALTFMAYVSPNPDIRKEASACEEEIGKFAVSVYTRKDLYLALKDVKPRSKEEKRLLSETIKRFEKNGLKLPDDKLARVKEKMQKLAVLESQFSSNLNNDTTIVEFTEKELDGVPRDFLTRLKKTADGARYIVTTKAPDNKQVMETAKSPETRKRMMLAYTNRAVDKNLDIIKDVIPLRNEIAELIGYKTWADFRTDGRMAKNSKNVLQFLNGLRTKLEKRNRKDLQQLLKFKKDLDPTTKRVDVWDIPYLTYNLKKRDYSLDDEKIREYFPTQQVLSNIFDIYSKLLGVSFVEVENAKTWAPDVKMYEIVDKKTKATLAYFYTDFFPREGKYSHFAAFSLIMGRTEKGGYSKPVATLVGNFTPPNGDKPSLLNHDEVETLFHEFGHIMHQTLTRAPYASLSGSEVARDFVETPSQMFEEWAWTPAILARLSGHYQTKKKIPATTIRQMIKSRDFNQGYFYTRQLFLALTDMKYHTSKEKLDPTAVYDELWRKIIGVEPLKGGNFPAGFGHLLGGYDAGYYSYLWADVYAADVATRFQKGGFLNPKIGMDYRRTILEKGNMEDGDKLVEKFLKRKHNNKAFFKKLGI